MRWSKSELKVKQETRDRAETLKEEIKQLIYPSTNYLCYFLEYYPDMNTQQGKAKIHSTWNGITASEEVVEMMGHVKNKIKNK